MTSRPGSEAVDQNGLTVVITQPTYLPWMGYFELVARADVFVFLDTVQFERRSWQCRNRLRGAQGEPFWLSVPIAAHPRDTPIRDIRISRAQPGWRAKHLRSIIASLGGAPYFDEVFPRLETWLSRDDELLTGLNVDGVRRIAESLGLAPEWRLASGLQASGVKGDLILDICRSVGAARYYASAGSRDYLEPMTSQFHDAGVELEFQGWVHPVYPQRGEGFTSHLSVVDALMNVGPAAVRDMVMGGSQ